MADQDALKRLSAAYRAEVDEVTKERHIAEMSAVIRTAPPAPISTRHALRSRAAGAVAAVLIVAAPVGMAVAAEDAVPGEFLYPLKQVTERVRALVDDDIAATHRVEEAERLVVRGAPIPEITRAVERAQVATSDLVDDGTLGPRLESIRERLRQQDDEERVLVEREELQSGQQNSRGSGGGEADPDGDQDGPGTGSATTSVPRSGGQGEGTGAGSTSGDSTPGDSPPTDGNAGTRGNNGAGETPEREGAGPGGDASPPTTARQGSTGTSGS
ncbi:MAG: hypothetical protein WBO25_07255 [Acidimicrobiia bacterium]